MGSHVIFNPVPVRATVDRNCRGVYSLSNNFQQPLVRKGNFCLHHLIFGPSFELIPLGTQASVKCRKADRSFHPHVNVISVSVFCSLIPAILIEQNRVAFDHRNFRIIVVEPEISHFLRLKIVRCVGYDNDNPLFIAAGAFFDPPPF